MARKAIDERSRIAPPLVRLAFWTGVAAMSATVTWMWFDASVNQPAMGDVERMVRATASVQVRAFDRGGHPVAGADVLSDGHRVGVTDSFGEMRRVMRVALGANMNFALEKSGASTRLFAERKVTVPSEMPREGEMEITVSVLMEQTSRVVARIADDDNIEDETVNSEPSPVITESLSRVAISVLPNEIAPRESDRARARQLRTAILPHVLREAGSLGLRVDKSASWHVTLRDLPVLPDESDVVGMVEVSGQNPALPDAPGFTYVVPYEKSNMNAARAILSPLATHIARPYVAEKRGQNWFLRRPANADAAFWNLSAGTTLTDPSGRSFRLGSGFTAGGIALISTENDSPCSARPAHVRSACVLTTRPAPAYSPAEGWRRYKFRVNGKSPQGIDVYAGAYRATLNAKGDWIYWAPVALSRNTTLTFVSKGAITSRLFVRDNPARPLSVNARMITPATRRM